MSRNNELISKPIILREGKNTKRDLEILVKTHKIWRKRDIYESQLRELFEISNPKLKKSKEYKSKESKFLTQKKRNGHSGNWIYFPWSGELIHCVNEAEYLQLRTNRNQNLITRKEQEILKNFCVGIAGLSVGSNIATGLSYLGIENLKLAEFDTLETTNLNRIRAGLQDIGSPKIEITAQQIYDLNPYANLTTYSEGLKKDNLSSFLKGKIKLDLVFEIIDDFEMKILLRKKAKEFGIPVIMLANVHDKVIIDIERYDLDKSTPLFNGILGDLPERILSNPGENVNRYAVEMVGRSNVSKKAINSVKEINKTLIGRPQLNSTVMVNSGLAVYLTRQIALKEDLPSGRNIVSFDKIIK